MSPLVTLIIPSLGRASLADLVASLYEQTNDNWNAVVCFDGDVRPNLRSQGKITVIQCPTKLGLPHNHNGGNVRNYAMDYAINNDIAGMYLGNLDDDDVITNNYVEDINEYCEENYFYSQGNNIEIPMPDVIVFQMESTDGRVLPPIGTNKFVPELENNIGISFAFRNKLFKDGIRFDPNNTIEDWEFLNLCYKSGASFHFMNKVGYLVHPLGAAADRMPPNDTSWKGLLK